MKPSKSTNSLSKMSTLLPVELVALIPELPNPTRSVYQAQLNVIRLLEKPEMLEAQSDLVLSYLDQAIALSPVEAKERLARSGALLIGHQLFLAYAFVNYEETQNSARLEEAVTEFVSNVVTDMAVAATEAGKTLNTDTIINDVLDSVGTRVKQDGKEFFSEIVHFLFGIFRNGTARIEFLDMAFRVVGKAARRPYFRGNGQHFVDLLKRHESEIIELAVKRARFGSSETSKILSAGQLAFVTIGSSIPMLLALSGSIFLTGFPHSFWGFLWRMFIWGPITYVVGNNTIGSMFRWLVRKTTENRLRRIYCHLEGRNVPLGGG